MTKFCSVAFLIFIMSPLAYGCSCLALSLEKEVEQTSIIFVGKVLERTQDKTFVPPKIQIASEFLQKMINSRKRWLLKIEVTESFKGVDSDQVNLVDYTQDGYPCNGILFKKDDVGLFFVHKNQDTGKWMPGGLCSRTQNFDEESEDYKNLRDLEKDQIGSLSYLFQPSRFLKMDCIT